MERAAKFGTPFRNSKSVASSCAPRASSGSVRSLASGPRLGVRGLGLGLGLEACGLRGRLPGMGV